MLLFEGLLFEKRRCLSLISELIVHYSCCVSYIAENSTKSVIIAGKQAIFYHFFYLWINRNIYITKRRNKGP